MDGAQFHILRVDLAGVGLLQGLSEMRYPLMALMW